jgi:four helix bundle protein
MSNTSIVRFEDLRVWQMAVERAAEVYELFAGCRDFGFKDQIQRAAVSISSNIAEGFERGSNKEFLQFLYYAKGSCGEVRSQLRLARRLGLLPESAADGVLVNVEDLAGKLGAFIRTRQTRFQ